jgi:sulfocyanin
VRARIGTVVLGALLMSAPIWSQSMMSTSGKLVPYKDADKILSYDAGAKTVSVNLEGSQGSAAYGMNFNNFAKGTMVIRVPVGWTVTVSLLVDSRLKHSAMVVPWSQREGEDFTPAFQGSEPKEYAVGIGKGQPKEEFTFKADRTGQYAVVCGVPGHAEAGMWDEFDVVAGTSAPEVLVKG